MRPQVLLDGEVGHSGVSELRGVGSMHERKALMAQLAEGFALPGGLEVSGFFAPCSLSLTAWW
jgi:hypothetical protein